MVDWKLSTEMCQSTGQYRYQKKCGIISSTDTVLRVSIGTKSGNFGHQVNSHIHLQKSGNPDETAPYEPSHKDFRCLLS